MDYFQVGVWAALGAPFCAAYAVAAANRAPLPTPAPAVGTWTTLAVACSVAVVVASARTPQAAIATLIFGSALAYLAVFDMRAMAIPVWPAATVAALGMLFAVLEGAGVERVCAALAGFAALAGLDRLYRAVRGRSGLGAGDALVAALIGAWLGVQGLVWSIAIGGVLGLVAALAQGRRSTEPAPFVPALAGGAAVSTIVLEWIQ